jgi:hypothetical protein
VFFPPARALSHCVIQPDLDFKNRLTLIPRSGAGHGSPFASRMGKEATMRFELLHALRGLDGRTPRFFKIEVFAVPDEDVKLATIEALTAAPTTVTATTRLKDMLRLIDVERPRAE